MTKSRDKDFILRTLTRATIVVASAIPMALAAPGMASATELTDITYAYSVQGNSISNTITSTADGTVHCSTSLAPAPDGVLPPLETVLREGQTLFNGGDVTPGVTTQAVTDVPVGSYVVLATCSLEAGDGIEAWWVSDYPGIAEYMDQVVPWTTYTVQQASTVLTVGDSPAVRLPDGPAEAFGS